MRRRGLRGAIRVLTGNVRPIPFLEIEAVRLSAPILRELMLKFPARDGILERLEAASGGTDKEVWKAYVAEFDYLNKLNKVCSRHVKKSRRRSDHRAPEPLRSIRSLFEEQSFNALRSAGKGCIRVLAECFAGAGLLWVWFGLEEARGGAGICKP